MLESQLTSLQSAGSSEMTAISLRLRAECDLVAKIGNSSHLVHLKPCFPWTNPNRYISVRDTEGNELYYLDSLTLLDPQSREAAEVSLAETGFVLRIADILLVEEDFELRVWRVRLWDGSQRTFQTKLDEWPLKLAQGGALIRDVSGDLFQVPEPRSLNQRSQKAYWAYIE